MRVCIKGGGLLVLMVMCLVQAQYAYAQDPGSPVQLILSETLEPVTSTASEAKTATEENAKTAIEDDSKAIAVTPKKSTHKKKSRRAAAVRSEVVLGIAAMDNRKPGQAVQFGKFTGVTDRKVYLIGAAEIQSHRSRRYWSLKADDLGLANRSISFDGGTMAKYKLHFGYSELDNLLSSTSQTPFNGAGETVLTLPAGFTRAPTTTGMADLAASLKPVELGTKRKEGDASFAFKLDQNLGWSLSFRRYLKKGTQAVGSVFRDDNSTPQSMVLPEPVNYHTDEFRTGFDWQGERSQANLDYYYSRFTNRDKSLTWDNPYIGDSPNPVPYPDQGRNSLPPNNQQQRLSVGGSLRLASTTRISALYEHGSMTQNDEFWSYTINSSSAIPVPMPRNSAEARIDITLHKLDLTTQPLTGLSLRAGYQHYATDNRTPRDLYQMVINDGGDQVAVNSAEARYNMPVSFSRDNWKLNGSYYVGKGTTLKLGYDKDQREYLYRAVDSTTENIYSARLNKRWNQGAAAHLGLAQGRKRADGYDHKRVFESAHTAQYLATLAPNIYFDNLPAMRQYDIADRDNARQDFGMTLLPRPDLTVGVNANRNDEKYDASQFGLQARNVKNITLDATLAPDETSSWSLYYTRQNITWRQTGRAYYPFGLQAAQAADPVNDWSAQNRDVIDTVGINIALSFLDDSLPVRFSYAYANIDTDISFTANPDSANPNSVNSPPSDMPTLNAVRQTIDLSGTYNLGDNLSIRGGAQVEIYRAKDWATDQVPPGSSTVPQVLTLSGSATPYQVILLSLALSYHF